jgi:homoserine O-acetyltransferase
MSILNSKQISNFSSFLKNISGISQTPELKELLENKKLENIKPTNQIFEIKMPFGLECGQVFDQLKINYSTQGTINVDASNVIWVCHALTADANPQDWWRGLIGHDSLYNPDDYFIVCANVIASPYGSTSPLDCDIDKRYNQFPTISIRDNINAFAQLRKHLKINTIHTLIGGSMGGHQAMEWAIIEPKRIENLVLLASSAVSSPWVVAFNQSQRLAIQADASFGEPSDSGGKNGLKAARSIALLSYRNDKVYKQTQADFFDFNQTRKAASYQNYQGDKLVARFNAYSYYALTKTMDSHDVGRNRGGVENALRKIKAKTLVIAIDSDILFSIEESRQLVQAINNAELHIIGSDFGHDGFLIETQQISDIIHPLLSIKHEK